MLKCPAVSLVVLAVIAVSHGFAMDQSVAESLHPELPLSAQLHRAFFLDDGLPSPWINDVVQTRDDYIWIASDNGLVRYDGIHFKLFNHKVTRQLAFDEIRVLHEDSDGCLWIGTTEGLTRYIPGRPGTFEAVPSITDKTVRAIYQDSANTLWIGTEEETFVRGQGLKFEILKNAPSNVRAICEDQNGTVWLGTHAGLYRLQGTTFDQINHERLPKRTSLASGIPETRVNAILADVNGDLWIGTNRALLHMRNGQFTSRGRELDAQQIYDIVRTRNGGLYVAARFGLYRCIGDGPFEKVSDEESAFSVMEDRQGSLWVGYGDNRGLHRYRNRHAQAFWTESRVRCIYDDPGGDLWFGSSDGLHHLRDGAVTDYGLDDGLPDQRVQTIAPASDGKTLWIGTARGFVKWSENSIVSAATPAALSEMNIGTAMEDSNGVLWFSLASAGGFRLKDGVLSELAGLNHQRIHWFWEGPDGVVWIGHESGLFQYHDGEIHRINDTAFERLMSPRILCHCIATDGTLWIGTSNGIVRHQSGVFAAFPPESGLRADNIERMVADDNGNLWFGGRDGLFHTSVAEMEAVAKGRLSQVTAYRVEGFDRFPPLSSFSQGCLVKHDVLWIAGEHGLARMPLKSFRTKPPLPIVHIEQATIDGVAAGFEERFEYKAGEWRLSIQFAVPAFQHPEQIQVRYRLDRYDDDWVNAGSDRDAQYTDLRPGDYTFRVSARNGNDTWIEADSPMCFTVLPRWWELMWLRVVAVLAVVVTGVGLTQYRIQIVRSTNAKLRREITERQKAEEESRRRFEQLARVSRAATMGELTTSIAHEVKQPLFAIVSNAQTARRLLDREVPDVAEVRDALDDIASDGNRASSIIDHVRSLVKKEHHPADRLDLNAIARDVIRLVDPELRARNLSITTRLAHDLPAVHGDSIELQQVVINLLINGAQAMSDVDPDSRTLTIRTSSGDGSVELAVEDHGIGVPEEQMDQLFEPFFTTKAEGTGMGLAINRTIIEAHGGRIWATMNKDGGSTFRFSLPSREGTS
jgi:ligand-binding sensor domain-containing protein/signal transduction histidine kinase